MELVQANWPLFVIAVVVGLIVAWWIFVALRRTKVETDKSDVLDEGKGPASRNQALIDAPPAATAPVVPPVGAPAAIVVPAETIAAQTIAPAAIKAEKGDDLTRIKGVGPKLKTLLNELGITRFAQIAGWNDADIDQIDAKLGRFEGRIRRDNWTEQARLLDAGDTAGYEDKFGKL
ncbi:hypothetical protein GCM10023115_23740 [Pontixanthobacter gangjinensis]